MKLDFAPSSVRFVVLTLFLAVVAFTGGTYRVDVPHLMILRPMAVLALVAVLLDHRGFDWHQARVPLGLLLAFGLTVFVQLIPLPPSWWLALPGHAMFADAAGATGLPQPWRPLSLTPDLTVNTLVSIIPALVVVVGFAGLSSRHRELTLVAFGAIGAVSALLALVQITGGGESPAYLYGVFSDNLPVGLLTNRNHQAALLAMMLPALAAAVATLAVKGRNTPAISVTAVAAGLMVVPMVLVTGSRFGLVGLLLALGGSGWIVASMAGSGRRKARFSPKVLWTAAVGLAVVMVGVSLWFGRAASINRLMEESEPERRIEALPVLFEMIRNNLPFGTGHGSFDAVFRVYEPDHLLYDTYFNHAHNDYLELLITGGLPALLVLVLLGVWLGRSAWKIARRPAAGVENVFGKLGVVVVVILAAGSVVDYPLRAPLMGVVFALACCWIAWATTKTEVRVAGRG